MLMLFSPDGHRDLSVRLARMVGHGTATLWADYADQDHAYGVAAAGRLAPGAAVTDVSQDAAAFEQVGHWTCRFTRTHRLQGLMAGAVSMTAGLHPTAEPPEGEGAIAGRIEATFLASHPPVAVRGGRTEVFGTARAVLHVPGRRIAIDGYAKWHEQVGERPRFAPAFTYVALCGADRGLLAVSRGGVANGFAFEGGRTTPVTALEISELASRRTFRAALADGRSVTGEARMLRSSSEPIEGQRRPSATVLAETSLGRLVGQINDWAPAG